MPELALEIISGAELERYQPNHVDINGFNYLTLTGYEAPGQCFWCGLHFPEPTKPWRRQHHYCRGHMTIYYQHFHWSWARPWCIERYEGNCANCGVHQGDALEVHHIVPLKGSLRWFTTFNLPWNLIPFCHACHLEVHAAMRPMPPRDADIFELAEARGQLIFEEMKV